MQVIERFVMNYPNVINIFIVFSLFAGFLFLLISVSMIGDAKQNFNRIMSELYERNERRVVEAEKERRKFGTTTKNNQDGLAVRFISHIDDKLVYSELSIQYRWLNASTYIAGTVVLAAIMLLLGVLMDGAILGLIFFLITVFGPYIYISNVAYAKYLDTEKQLEFFINLVASNSVASSDLFTILERIAPRCLSPVKNAIYRASYTAKLAGKSDDGIAQLIREIEYPLFKEFIRNLDICGKQDADYRNVSKDFSKQAETQLRAIERQRAIFTNARNEVILMIGMGLLLSWMTANFSEMSLVEVLKDMRTSLLGIACLVGEVLVYASSIIYILVGKRK